MSRTWGPLPARARILGAILTVASVGLIVVGGLTLMAQRAMVIGDVDDALLSQRESFLSLIGAVTGGDPGGARSPVPDPATGIVTTEPQMFDADDLTSLSDFLHAAVGTLAPGRHGSAMALIGGEPRFRTPPASGFDVSENADVIARAGQVSEATAPTSSTAQGAVRYVAIPVTVAGDTGVYVHAIDLDAELAPVHRAMVIYAVTALATLGAIGVVGWFVVGNLLSPMRRLRETADSITLTELGARIPTARNDDISEVTLAVNAMLDRLEGSIDVQRQLLDDVRHELKTPITIVRGYLEMMDTSDAGDVNSARDIGIAELDRMTRLVDDIDLLATVEGGQFTMGPVEVSALTAKVGELVVAIPGHEWMIDAHGSGMVEGDPDRLVQAWLQLADNAAKYADEGSPIEIGSDVDGLGARLWVQDHGPGIPPAARHRIFRRFDRAHVRRSVGGSGLGLAIVDAITKQHGGNCTVSDTPGGGATFTIHLPVRPGAPVSEIPAPVRAGDVVMQREATG